VLQKQMQELDAQTQEAQQSAPNASPRDVGLKQGMSTLMR
jgi:hypothetical protein